MSILINESAAGVRFNPVETALNKRFAIALKVA